MTLPWLFAFVWTLAIEIPIYAAVLGRGRRTLALAIAVNVLTHPLLWIVRPPILPGEMLVAATEAAICAAVTRRPTASLLAAGLANLASYELGVILFRML